MKLFEYILLIAVLLNASNCTLSGGTGLDKINGVSLVSPHFRADSTMMASVRRVHASWVAVIPIAFSRKGAPEIHYNTEYQWWGERLEGTSELVRLAHRNDLQVMIKPHVWLREQWVGEYSLPAEEDWLIWEDQYSRYILDYARLAESLHAEMFCIGTEYKQAVAHRPEFWHRLIWEVRQVYTGKLTYAANWDNYERIPFWDQLDYIGIDAYFPLIAAEDPALEDLAVAWGSVKNQINRVSREWQKPILFTEYGYQSVDGAAGKHWEVSKTPDRLNHPLQSRCYEALYRAFWSEEWFAGGFLWKWHFDESGRADQDMDFTPQGKLTETVISEWYGISAVH